MAVNVGYSIGWGYPAEKVDSEMIFSSIYVLFGSSLVALALGFFADNVIADKDSWYDNLQASNMHCNDFSLPSSM